MASQPERVESHTIQPIQIETAAQPEQGSLPALLQYEGEVRRQATVPELVYHIANETRRITAYDQMFVLRHARVGEGYHVEAVSSMAVVDRNAPLIHFIEQVIAKLAAAQSVDTAQPIDAADHAGLSASALDDYPFHAWFWQPLRNAQGDCFAGLLTARTRPLLDVEAMRMERVGETVAHAWCALTGNKPVHRIKSIAPRERKGMMVLAAGLMLFPVQMTARAPVEVVAERPFVISAPFAGVVGTIAVTPNQFVRKGQVLIRFDDIKFRNELTLATQKLEVARARVERASSASFSDKDQSHEVSIERAELDLAQAEFAYAQDMMGKTQLIAPRDGMAIFTDRRDWEGRAVNVGEPIMQVADAKAVGLRIDLPAKEQMNLAPGGVVKVWLDSQPLWAIDARLQTASYQARPTPEGVLAFAVTAKPIGDAPRIGSRGTAELRGHWAPLGYSLLKRPIASFRQYIGL